MLLSACLVFCLMKIIKPTAIARDCGSQTRIRLAVPNSGNAGLTDEVLQPRPVCEVKSFRQKLVWFKGRQIWPDEPDLFADPTRSIRPL